MYLLRRRLRGQPLRGKTLRAVLHCVARHRWVARELLPLLLYVRRLLLLLLWLLLLLLREGLLRARRLGLLLRLLRRVVHPVLLARGVHAQHGGVEGLHAVRLLLLLL